MGRITKKEVRYFFGLDMSQGMNQGMSQGMRLGLGLLLLGLHSLSSAEPLKASPQRDLLGNYPVKPIRVVVPFNAGGPNDFVARVVGQKLSADWGGQPLVIDNRAGAGGNLGTALVARAPGDGYTVLLAGLHFVVNPALYADKSFDIEKDFVGVTNVAISAVVIVANPRFSGRNVQELQTLAKSNRINYGSPGSGTAGHLAAECWSQVAGVSLQHIPYKGAAPVLSDLLGGQIELAFTALPPVVPHVRAGRLKALAVTTRQRSSALPEVPTVEASGYSGFFVDNMYGWLMPRATPPAIVKFLNTRIANAVASSEVKQRLNDQGYETIANRSEEFASYLHSELLKWTKVVHASSMRVE